MSLDQKVVSIPRQGGESFSDGTSELGFSVADFWRWSASDLLSNTMRGILAEYIVARALGIADDSVRVEWEPYDLHMKYDGLDIRIEVKSSAYLQTWAQRSLSNILFGIAQTRGWNANTGLFDGERRRHADIYIFAVLTHVDKSTVNPLDVSQWDFYVVPTTTINDAIGPQKTLRLSVLRKLAGNAIPYSGLRDTALQRTLATDRPDPIP